jgi:hypothetical protein
MLGIEAAASQHPAFFGMIVIFGRFFQKAILGYLARKPGLNTQARPANEAADRSGLAVLAIIRATGGLQFSEQNEDQQNDDHQSKAAATVVTRAVEWTAANATEAAEQGDH